MKKRLPYIVLALMGAVLLGMSLYDAVNSHVGDLFQTCFGFYCLLFGGYKSVHPQEKE